MRYRASVTSTFEIDVPGDSLDDDLAERCVQTSAAAAEVISNAAKQIGAVVLRYDNPEVTFSGEPVSDEVV